ncbi:MAG TPA: DUF4926 domain-containing protein [Humisphaera sp.]|jgi:hypothetical protein|nr:DUF4926 domain-containing protein [Humisphaera sp.]
MSEQLQEFDVVALLSDSAEDKLSAGQTGAVVYVYDGGKAFEVEFPLTARNSVVATLPRKQLLKLKGQPFSRAGN